MLSVDHDFLEILRVLSEHNVEHIVIGGLCAVLHGAAIITQDVDFVHARTPENIDRLLAALADLQATYREPGDRRLPPNPGNLAATGPNLFRSRLGPLDALGTVDDRRGYEELLPHSDEVRLDEGFTIRILNLATLIEIKEAAGRDKDRMVLPILRQALLEQEKET